LAFTLELLGYKVSRASDAQSGLRILEDLAIDLVVTDVHMPGATGLHFYQKACELMKSPPPFILSTGHAELCMSEAFASGAEGVLIKPFTLDDFQHQVKKATTPLRGRWTDAHPQGWNLGELKTVEVALPSWNSLWKAEANPQATLGRGGIALHHRTKAETKGSPVNLPTSLETMPALNEKLRFKIVGQDLDFPSFEGLGITRWLEPVNSFEWKVGIEFVHLESRCREDYFNFIEQTPPRSFIPRFH
jgi:CheY-like chemotaxis protein